MGLMQSLSSVARPLPKGSASNYYSDFFSGADMPDMWMSSLTASGVTVTPDLAMTLSALACGVRVITSDIATLPLQTYRLRDDGGKDLVRGKASDTVTGGIADLAYMMRWAPNDFQTASEYFISQITQWLLRGVAYAEIVPGPTGFLGQLLPRHPDRVTPERLPNGRLRYKLTELSGSPRYLSQDEMHVVRDNAQNGLKGLTRIQYGAPAIGTGLAAERAAGKFFKSGMAASVLASYKGDMDDEAEAALHRSISRYAAGVENTFGLLLVPDDVTVKNLAVEPDKAQMMQARAWTVNEVARLLNISPRKLHVRGQGDSYSSAVQDSIDHVVTCLRPICVFFEQAIQRDLILAKDTYFVKFNLRELLQADPQQLGDYIEKLVRARAMTPSEARMLLLDLNPSEALDRLSASDNQPGKAAPAKAEEPARPVSALSGRLYMKGLLAMHDAAVRAVRRERAAVEKLAKKHAGDPAGWQASLREFYEDHAGFVSEVMRVSMTVARGYVAQHGTQFTEEGIPILAGDSGAAWERHEADELAALAAQEAA